MARKGHGFRMRGDSQGDLYKHVLGVKVVGEGSSMRREKPASKVSMKPNGGDTSIAVSPTKPS